jgi:hypothetical protein
LPPHRSTCDPPHEQLLMRLGAGGVSVGGAFVGRVPCRPLALVPSSSHVVPPLLSRRLALAPHIHPASSCLQQWCRVLVGVPSPSLSWVLSPPSRCTPPLSWLSPFPFPFVSLPLGCRCRSTHHPPHGQLLVGLGAGGVSFVTLGGAGPVSVIWRGVGAGRGVSVVVVGTGAVPHVVGPWCSFSSSSVGGPPVCPPSSLSLSHPVFTPRAVAHGGGGGCWLPSVLWGRAWVVVPCLSFPCRRPPVLAVPPHEQLLARLEAGGGCGGMVSVSSSSFHPRSTPRAVAREAGGRWYVVMWRWPWHLVLLCRGAEWQVYGVAVVRTSQVSPSRGLPAPLCTLLARVDTGGGGLLRVASAPVVGSSS